MYKDMYKTFDDAHIPYNYPHSFQDKKQFDYLNGIEPTYEMDYGDTTTIPFQVKCEYMGYNIDIIIYNFRYEKVYSVTTTPDACGTVYLEIGAETSEDILKKGLYFIQIQAYTCIPGGNPVITTLLSPSDCSIRVR